jgi:adenylyltransferase/sulfurtransferase
LEEEFGGPAEGAGARDAPVIVYCAGGRLSQRAAGRIRAMGFAHTRSVRGGYEALRAAGCEVVFDGAFTAEQLDRYSRTMVLKEIGEEGQVRLMEAKVLLVGAGALASTAAPYLAACGVGTVGIVDSDVVDLSNLNRQVIHSTNDVGRPKVDSARDAIGRLNPNVKVITFPMRLVPANALEIIGGFDVVLDASDNVGTKFLLNDACFFAHKPYIFGGAVGFDGQAGVFFPKEGGPCLRCLFPVPPPQHLAPSCSQVGVLGMVPGQIGLVQATEAVKLILKIGTSMIGRFFIYDALRAFFQVVETARRPDCPLCGETPRITGLIGPGSAHYEGVEACGEDEAY